jgi:peptidoglycan hydrolase-like amidase
MHRRLAAWVCALTLAASAVALPSTAATVEAAAACTDWSSAYAPPTTIRVLRSYGSASGKVQAVPFRAYVENVMAWEWPETYPTHALRVGAVAVKQYGWYYARTWRGGKAKSGACYDVKDTSTDQIYRPETRSAGPRVLAAIAATWNLSIRRKRDGQPGRFILTGYVPGSVAE